MNMISQKYVNLLKNRLKEKISSLTDEFINFFEILTLSIETGRNLQEALNVTVTSNYGELVDILDKEVNISELNSNDLNDSLDNSFLGIELKDIIDIVLTKEMKDIIKIYGGYLKYVERQEKPDINKFINSREIRDISIEQNEKMKAINSKYFIFSLSL